MRRENQIRRPKERLKKDIERSLNDAAHAGTADTVISAVHEHDATYKALTGRVKETYIALSGLPENELLPEGADILNIGDPYLKLDLPGVLSIDYETGEQSQFCINPEGLYVSYMQPLIDAQDQIREWISVLNQISQRDASRETAFIDLQDILQKMTVFTDGYLPHVRLKDRHAIFDVFQNVQHMLQPQMIINPDLGNRYTEIVQLIHTGEDIPWLCYQLYGFYLTLLSLEEAAELPEDQKAFHLAATSVRKDIFPKLFKHSTEDLPKFQEELEPIFKALGDLRGPDKFLEDDTQVIDMFYTIWKLKNGLRDIYSYKKFIEPGLEKEAFAKNWSDEEYIRQQEIAIQQYLEPPKRTHMDFKIAIFPDTPFPDQSFDRIIASWSVTAHIFPELDAEGYLAIWRECARLLRPGGKAYMWPVGYSRIAVDDFLASIDAYTAEGGVVGFGFLEFIDNDPDHNTELKTVTSKDPRFAQLMRDKAYGRAVHLIVLPPASRQHMERYQG